jgi:hypothetical protein
MLLLGTILFYTAKGGEMQSTIKGHANGFDSTEYYAPPNETLVKTRMSGAEAQPLAGGLLAITQLKMETFGTNGVPQFIVEAPECVYDMVNRTANSAGHVRLRNGDGKLRMEGDGFLWRQDDSSLTISNHVDSVVKTSAWKLNLP